MQKQMSREERLKKQEEIWKKVDQHPLNKEALEILRVLQAVAEYPNRVSEMDLEELPDPVLWTPLPILDLMRWGEAPSTMSGMEHYNRELTRLEEMASEGYLMETIQLIVGPHGERDSIAVDLWTLQEGTPKEREAIEQELRSTLNYLLIETQHELNLRLQNHEQLMDVFRDRHETRQQTTKTDEFTTLDARTRINWFFARREAQEDKGRIQNSKLTPEQEELLSDWTDIINEDTLTLLIREDILDDFDQELLAALQANMNILRTDQGVLLKDWFDFVYVDTLETLRWRNALYEFVLDECEKELLEALQSAETFLSKSTPKQGFTLETEIDSESKNTSNPTSTQEKVVHYSGEEVEASDSAIDCYNRGRLKHNSGQYEAAITDYDNAICLKPNYSLAYNKRGLAKYYLGQYENAIADYDNAIRLKPDYAFAYNNRGLVKYYLGQYENAIADYDNAIRLRPNFPLAYRNRKEAEAKLSLTCEAEQVSDITISEQETRALASDQDFNPKEENTVQNPEDQGITSEPQVKEKSVHYSEDQIKDIVADYFESLHTDSPGYSVKREYLIQMGSDQRRADVVFLRNGKLVTIAECKETGRVRKGIDQLKSYLCATDTFLGIFANDGDPNKWTFWENHRHNNFLEIDRETFENYVCNHGKTIKDRENKIKAEVQREIDAEIRERVRKNTDTGAVRQNETDRIKREITENIDRTAVVNSVKSQMAEQAKNGLLNKRDKENRKLGRAQGFWWSIFGIVGIGILIAMLMSA